MHFPEQVAVSLPSSGSGVGSNLTDIFGGTSRSIIAANGDGGSRLKMAVAAQGAELFMLSDGEAEQCASAPPPPPGVPSSSSGGSSGNSSSSGGGWKLVWSDEFDGPAGTPPNASYWSIAGVPHSGVDPTHGPIEQQLYVPEAVALDGAGHVVIETKRQVRERQRPRNALTSLT